MFYIGPNFNENITSKHDRNRKKPIREGTKVKVKGSIEASKDICMAMHDMLCLTARNKDIGEHYKLKPSTVPNTIGRLRKTSAAVRKERRHKDKLLPIALHIFQRYVNQLCFEPLRIVVALFSA